jgi:hypothetical protein
VLFIKFALIYHAREFCQIAKFPQNLLICYFCSSFLTIFNFLKLKICQKMLKISYFSDARVKIEFYEIFRFLQFCKFCVFRRKWAKWAKIAKNVRSCITFLYTGLSIRSNIVKKFKPTHAKTQLFHFFKNWILIESSRRQKTRIFRKKTRSKKTPLFLSGNHQKCLRKLQKMQKMKKCPLNPMLFLQKMKKKSRKKGLTKTLN